MLKSTNDLKEIEKNTYRINMYIFVYQTKVRRNKSFLICIDKHVFRPFFLREYFENVKKERQNKLLTLLKVKRSLARLFSNKINKIPFFI